MKAELGDTAPRCSIERALAILGDRWTLLVLREALLRGAMKFSDFETSIDASPSVLTDRLNLLVRHAILEKQPYRVSGERTRHSYHPTEAAAELVTILGAFQQWGDAHAPVRGGPTVERISESTHRPLHVSFVDDLGNEVRLSDVAFRGRT